MAAYYKVVYRAALVCSDLLWSAVKYAFCIFCASTRKLAASTHLLFT